MKFSLQAKSVFFLTGAAGTALSSASASAQDIVWTASGGGWRAMVAQSAYAQVFSKLGILGGNGDIEPQIKVMATSSGSDWFASQFAFSENYYNAVINGNATSLGQFTQEWMEAYATTQAFRPLCEVLCDRVVEVGPAVEEVAALLPMAYYYNFSWPEIIYAMYNATSTMVYDDPNFVSAKASLAEKNVGLKGVDVCFHMSLLPNARAYDADTITYLARDYANVSSSYTVPISYAYCVGDNTDKWLPGSWPGGNVYNLNKNTSFACSNVVKGFPMFPPTESDGLYVTPQHDKDTDDAIVSLSPADMSLPFGNDPTAVQISTASSSTVGYVSEEAASYFAQYFSVTDYGIRHNSGLTEEKKLEYKTALRKLQDYLWSTGDLANAATMSGWTEPNPATMPPATESNYWFTDGGYTDGPAAAQAIARYQQLYGTSTPIKLIICNQNYITNNNNNIIDYFSYSGNEGIAPGEFIWPMGVGAGPQVNPQMSKQIFGEAMSAEELNGLFEPVSGTNLTMAVLPVATTVDNEPFGVKAGQEVSIAVINLNSNIPTFVITEEVIQAETPGLVSLAESIASSQDLADKVAAFVGSTTATVSGTNDETSSVENIDNAGPTLNEVADAAEPEVVVDDVSSSPPAIPMGQLTTDPPSSATTAWNSMVLLLPWTSLFGLFI